MTPENIKYMQQPEVQKFFQEMHERCVRNQLDLQRKLDEFLTEIAEGKGDINED